VTSFGLSQNPNLTLRLLFVQVGGPKP